MTIFSKKYDLYSDRLMRRYAPEEGYYYVKVIDGKIEKIDNSSLNSKTKKALLNDNKELLRNPELLETEYKRFLNAKRFQKLNDLGYRCNSFSYLGPCEGKLSVMMEDYLNKLVAEEDVLLGIHRVKGSTPVEEAIPDILENGLIIFGHFDGAIDSEKDLSTTVSYYSNNETIITELMYANEYKNASGSILIRIPDEDLKDPSKIYISDGSMVRVNPKYILGFVPVTDDHYVDRIITRDDLKKSNSTKATIASKEQKTF